MSHYKLGLITVRLERICITGEGDDDAPPACPKCSGMLDYTQPDPADPDRLIAACGDCRVWYLIERSPEDATLEMMALPCRAARGGPLLADHWGEEIDGRSFQAGA